MKSVDLLTNAQAELEQLQPLRTRLAESLTLHVNRLQATGEPPSEELLDNLRDYRRRLVELSGCLPTGIYQGPQLDRDETTLSWESLRGALRNYQLQLKAMEVLDEIEALRHKDDSEFVPLIECQRNAARLADSIRAGSTDAETNEPLHSLNAGNHPYCMLMTLVVHGDELADEVWTEFNDQVIGAFGRPLATAVARGKIELIPIESVSPVAELDSLDPVEVSVEPEAEEASDTLQVVPDIHESEISTVQIDFQNRDVTDSPAIDDLTEQPALSRHSVELILELSACNSILSEEPQEQEAETADVSHQEVSGLFLVRPQGRQPAVDSILSDHSADSI
ncbi:MAG: putative lyase, partial [Planctomycetaceae bacterium]|nr:putative lyase [Planctomycetaceae bacterium]